MVVDYYHNLCVCGFWKKSLESAPKFSGRSGNRKHNYFFFWPYCLEGVSNPAINRHFRR